MAQTEFTVDKVGWHTQTSGNTESRAQIEQRFRYLFAFLAKNELLSDQAPEIPPSQLPDEFMLHSSHLTEFGLEIIRAGYDKWLKALDRGTTIEKATALESALAKALKARA